MDLFPGTIVFHIRETDPTEHKQLEQHFRHVAESESLAIESLWFQDTSSSQIALIEPELAS